MTRKEAYNKAAAANLVAHPHRLVDMLEVLGLLKFDEEITPMDRVRNKLWGQGYFHSANHLDDLLKEVGCKIVEDK